MIFFRRAWHQRLWRLGFVPEDQTHYSFSGEEKRKFLHEIWISNIERIRFLLPVIIILSLIVTISDWYAMKGIHSHYSSLFFLHLAYLMVMVLIAACDVFALVLGRDGWRRVTFLGSLAASCAMAIGTILLNQRINHQVSTYYTLTTSVAVVVLMQTPTSIAVFSFLFLSAAAGLKVFQPDSTILISQVMDALVMTAISLFFSRVIYYTRLTQFVYRRRLEMLNSSLEDQVKIRSGQLAASTQLAAVGMHTAQIIHNLKSPLAVVKGNTDLLQNEYPDEPKITRLQNGVRKLEEIIRAILISSTTQNSNQPCPVSLNEVIRQELQFLEAADEFIKYQVQVDLKLEAPDSVTIRGVPTHFKQCISNLLRNALDAMFESPTKQLRVRSNYRTEAEKSWFSLEVTDTGCGIPTEAIQKVFDPFFTTKPLSPSRPGAPVGTGLGLSYCQQVVNNYKGRIEIESQPGRGSTFKVYFPV